MQTIATAELFHRCMEHGIWFDKDDRNVITRALAEEIARHRAVRELAAALRRGDERSFRSIAGRILDLEAKVARLQNAVARRLHE